MRVFVRLAAFACAVLLSWPVAAQNYPSRPVKFIVPFGAGGPADVFARVIAQHLSEDTKQSFIVEDRPGAGSVIGTDAVAKSAPDGYTLLVMSNTHTTNESLLPNKPFQLMRDFVPVATINYSDLLMVVHPSVPAKTVQEFIDLAKKDSGKLNYASSGPGTPYHMAGELFKAMSQTDIVHVPHKASGDARNSVVSGTVQMMFDAITTMSELAKAGQVRALGTTGLKRSELTPDLPTIAETVPGYEATIWLGVMAPKGTPKEIVDKLNVTMQAILNRPDMREKLKSHFIEPTPSDPATFAAMVRQQLDVWGEKVKIAGIQPE